MLRFDIHLHTSRYSADSTIDPDALIPNAIKRGLHGVVITEHHHQWTPEETAALVEAAKDAPGFICLSGLEYTTSCGDLLVYGIDKEKAMALEPGAEPAEAAAYFAEAGAACVAAHPTRELGGFDDRIFNLPIVALEAQSTRIAAHETQLALNLAEGLQKPITIASDAHRVSEIGQYCLEFPGHVRSISELRDSLQAGTFRLPAQA